MEKLGIDLKLIIVQIINFGILFIILKKVLYKTVLDSIKKRQEKLQSIDSEKLSVEKKSKELSDAKSDFISKSHEEKTNLLEEVKRQAEKDRKVILEKANLQAKEIIKNTQKQLLKEKDRMEKDFEVRVNKKADELVRSVLADSLDKATQKRLIDFTLRKISKS